jgi:hypothetical protein
VQEEGEEEGEGEEGGEEEEEGEDTSRVIRVRRVCGCSEYRAFS